MQPLELSTLSTSSLAEVLHGLAGNGRCTRARLKGVLCFTSSLGDSQLYPQPFLGVDDLDTKLP
jgi:hypothetical protein